MDNANKKIAKNTVIVYLRVFVTMFLGLLSSRYVLQILGESDFGLYSAVGSIIIMATFILGSLSLSTTRFLNYEKGLIDGDVNKVFNVSFLIHILFALVIFIFAEILGLIYIKFFLNVDPSKLDTALFIFQISTIISCLTVIGAPFQSLFVIHEKFSLLAIIEICAAVLKFGLILSLMYVHGDKLKIYAIYMGIGTIISTLACIVIAIYKWPHYVKLQLVTTSNHYKRLLAFNSYNLLGSGSLMLRNQGSVMLINYFFGTTVNAAYAIANSVQSYINIFVGNFDSASAPQIMQKYASGEKGTAINATCRTCRICILLMCIVYFPLVSELDTILTMWLGTFPKGTDVFCKYTLGIAIVSSTSGGLGQLIMAYGKIKWYQIQYSILYVLCMPIAWVLFKNGCSPYIITILFIIADILSRINQLLLLRRDIDLDIALFIKESYLRPLLVFIVMSIFIKLYQSIDISGLYIKIFGIITTFFLTISVVFFIGLKQNERIGLLRAIKSRFNKIK